MGAASCQLHIPKWGSKIVKANADKDSHECASLVKQSHTGAANLTAITVVASTQLTPSYKVKT